MSATCPWTRPCRKGALKYNGEAVAEAIVTSVTLVEWTVVGITVRYELVGTKP